MRDSVSTVDGAGQPRVTRLVLSQYVDPYMITTSVN